MMAIVQSVNEKSTCRITVTFTDEDGVLAAPSAISYSVRDQATNTILVADTSITPPSSTIEVTLSSAVNTLIYQGNLYETRVVTIQSTYGAGGVANAEYEYQVKNLRGVS
jgi:hypothetical protein